MSKELELTFRVPETDFDGSAVEAALIWTEEMLKADPFRSTGADRAYRVLKCIHDKYMDAIGQPEWKRPNYE